MQSFNKWLNEVKDTHLNKIRTDVDPKHLNMDHVFGEKLRIAININGNEDPIFQFIRLVKDATQHQLTLDEIRQGTVTQTIKTQQGEKERTLTIGNFLQRNKRQDLMNMWSQVKDRIQNIDNTEDYSIIISRSPVDLLRMSDHIHPDGHEIQSCHSPGNGWFHCAIQEAKTGGAIAYAVKTSDLINTKLQDKEIFKDQDRNKDGIIPLERVRLRRFTLGQTEILIPEFRTYPASIGYNKKKSVPGFREAVLKWAKDTQQAAIEQVSKSYGDPKKAFAHADLRGGSYQDNNAGELWSDFFNTKVFGKKKSRDQSRDGSKDDDDEPAYLSADEWEDQAHANYDQHRENWQNNDQIDVNFNATDPDDHDGDAWGHWSATITWEIETADFTKAKTPDAIKGLTDYVRAAGYREINSFKISGDQHWIKIIGKLQGDFDNGSLEDFEGFLDDVGTVDQNYDTIFSYIKALLAHKEYLHTNITQSHKNIEFKHFKFELNTKAVGNQGHYFLRTTETPIGTLADYPSDKDYISATGGRLWLPWDLINYLNIPTPLPQGIRVDRQAFFTLHEDHNYGDYALNMKVIGNEPLSPTKLVSILFSFTINVNEETEEADKIFQNAKHIDDNFDQLITKLQEWWNTLKAKLKEYHDNKHINPMPEPEKPKTGDEILRARMAAWKAQRANQTPTANNN